MTAAASVPADRHPEPGAQALAAALCGAAVDYSREGWPVLPLDPESGRPVCSRPPDDPDQARQWWSDRPYGIGCPAGVCFDVVQMPSWLGERLLLGMEHIAIVWEVQRPLACTWWFLVTPGAPIVTELRHVAPGVQLHGTDALVRLPPTPVQGGISRWVARQPHHDEPPRLPHSLTLQWAAIRAANAARTEPSHSLVTGSTRRLLVPLVVEDEENR